MSTKVGVALIGTGMVATAHAKAFQELADQIEVVGVYSRNSANCQAFAKKWQLPAVTELSQLVANPAVAVAIIITPPNARKELVEKFAAAGKHILLEKPVERSFTQAQEIVDICSQHKVFLGVVFQHRYRAASRKLQELISTDNLGQLHIVQATVPWWREQSYYDEPGRGTYARDGGGVLISQAIHTLDLMLALAGPVTEVHALAATTKFHHMEAEDFVSAGLKFANGAVGSFQATTAAYPGKAETLTLGFAKATAHLEAGTLTLHWRDGTVEEFGEPSGTGGGADPMAFPHAWHKELIANFCTSVKQNTPPTPTGEQALAVQQLIDALSESATKKTAITITND